jgi:hypothetical protein
MLLEIELKKLHQYRNCKAFTILELVIIVAIVSLLLLLVTQGSRFLEATHLKAIYNEGVRYRAAVTEFRHKYNFLPGDFPYSDKFFTTNCASNASYCNGDGDGFVKTINLAEKNLAGYSEPLLFWRHLALAGYIEGRYTGKAQEVVADRDCDSYYLCCTKEDCPTSSYNQGIYSYYSWPDGSGANDQCGSTSSYYPQNINILHFGKYLKGGNNFNAVISAEKAYLLDLKFDDSLPTMGVIQARNGQDILVSGKGSCMVTAAGARTSNNNAYEQNYKYNANLSSDQCVVGFLDLENSICQLP